MTNDRHKHIVITIDGPAASGKSTTAKLIAKKFGWLYLDTGAMYRAMAVKTLREGISLDDTERIGELVKKVKMKMEQTDSGMRIYTDGLDVSRQIRTPKIDKAVGPVCEVPAVRDEMVRLQRSMLQYGNLVTDGRDMGTVVFPDADLKFYLTASIEARAKRRLIDMKNQGIGMTLEALKKEIALRDERDSSRPHSPLRKAEDAEEIDTSGLTIEEQAGLIVKKVETMLKDRE